MARLSTRRIDGGQRRRLLTRLSAGNLVFLLLVWLAERFVAERYWLTTLLVYVPQHPLGAPSALLALWALFRREWGALAANVVALAFFAFALLGVNVPLGGGSHAGGTPLRVMTFNIEHGAAGAVRIAGVVKRAQPDLLCVQEANAFGRWRDPVPALRRLLPGWKVARHGELATFSRTPILERRVHPLSIGTGRALLETVVAVDGRRLTVFNVHLSTAATPATMTRRSMPLPQYVRHTAAVRAVQVSTLLSVAGDRSPLLIMGDFNNPPRGRLYRRMVGRFQDAFRAAGWGLGDTYPARFPVLRIDYVFAGKGIRVRRCAVLKGAASDHRPTVAEIVLE